MNTSIKSVGERGFYLPVVRGGVGGGNTNVDVDSVWDVAGCSTTSKESEKKFNKSTNLSRKKERGEKEGDEEEGGGERENKDKRERTWAL